MGLGRAGCPPEARGRPAGAIRVCASGHEELRCDAGATAPVSRTDARVKRPAKPPGKGRAQTVAQNQCRNPSATGGAKPGQTRGVFQRPPYCASHCHLRPGHERAGQRGSPRLVRPPRSARSVLGAAVPPHRPRKGFPPGEFGGQAGSGYHLPTETRRQHADNEGGLPGSRCRAGFPGAGLDRPRDRSDAGGRSATRGAGAGTGSSPGSRPR